MEYSISNKGYYYRGLEGGDKIRISQEEFMNNQEVFLSNDKQEIFLSNDKQEIFLSNDKQDIDMDMNKKEEGIIQQEKEQELSKYKYIKTDYTFLYNLVVNNDLDDNTNKDINVLNTMLRQIKKIDNKEVSKENGERKVGELLAETYIKPLIEIEKEKRRTKK